MTASITQVNRSRLALPIRSDAARRDVSRGHARHRRTFTLLLTAVMLRTLLPAFAVAVLFAGCKAKEQVEATGPDYSRQLGPGERALRKLGPNDPLPDIAAAYRDRDPFLLDAADQSRKWFQAPSSRQFFPFEDITAHDQAEASVIAFRELLMTAPDERTFVNEFFRLFEVYQSVGYNGEGVVLFTGYFSPEFRASPVRTPEFNAPLYKRPADLVTDPVTGTPMGRRLPDGSTVPYWTRAELEDGNMLAGNELVWVEDDLSAYIIQVNGSAKLTYPDGSVHYIGYAGKTDRPYVGLGRSLVEAGLIPPDRLSLAAIRDLYRRNPQAVRDNIRRNESYVFFQEYDGGNWPSGSLGVKVTERTTLATDKRIYPRGGVVFVDTQAITYSRGTERFQRFMFDQDTGGAIQAPGRADIFMGIGPGAEILAGGQYAEGTLYYFFLRPEYVQEYLSKAKPRPVTG